MNPRDHLGGASVPSIAALPSPRRGRVRKSQGMNAAGLISLSLLDREGEAVPANIARIDRAGDLGPRPLSAELLLARLIFMTLPDDQQSRIRQLLRSMVFERDPDPAAIQLHDMLSGKGGDHAD